MLEAIEPYNSHSKDFRTLSGCQEGHQLETASFLSLRLALYLLSLSRNKVLRLKIYRIFGLESPRDPPVVEKVIMIL